MITNWEAAEELALAHMIHIGFDDAELTGRGRDHGRDVVAARAVAQVKFETAKTKEPQIRDVFGTAKREGKTPVFYSLAGYTDAAIAWANRSVALFQYSKSGEITPINSRAHALAAEDSVAAQRNAGQRPAPTAGAGVGNGFAKFAVIAVAVIIGFIALSSMSAKADDEFKEDVSEVRGEVEVTRAAYEEAGKVWPFKFDEGVLQCRGEQQVITGVFDGVVYGLEGVEDYRLEGLGWYPSSEIVLDDEHGLPGATLSIDDVLHEGRSACASSLE